MLAVVVLVVGLWCAVGLALALLVSRSIELADVDHHAEVRRRSEEHDLILRSSSIEADLGDVLRGYRFDD